MAVNPSSIAGTIPTLYYDQVDDLIARKCFQNLNDYFSTQNQFYGFNFFEVVFTAATANKLVKHGLSYVPQDVSVVRVTGQGQVTFNFGLFDSTNVNISASGPCRVRFFVGTYWNYQNSVTSAASDTQMYSSGPPGALTVSTTVTSGSTTTLFSGSSNVQVFTGTATQIVTLPLASTLQAGTTFQLNNRSTGALTVTDNAGLTLGTLALNGTMTAVCLGTTWDVTVSTTAAIASTNVSRDVNVNSFVNNLVTGISTVATAGGTTALTVKSARTQRFTGIAGQTIVLPSALTLPLGTQFYIVSKTVVTTPVYLTVNDFGGTLSRIITPGGTCLFTLTANTTAAGAWDSDFNGIVTAGMSGGAFTTGTNARITGYTGAWDTAACLSGGGVFTAPFTGYVSVQVCGVVRSTAGTGNTFLIRKNGGNWAGMFAFYTAGFGISSAAMVPVNKGDFIDFAVDGVILLGSCGIVTFNMVS